MASAAQAHREPRGPASYEEDFLVRMAYNSNAIEGSTLTLAETEIIYEGEFVPGKPGREQIAARGIFEGHNFLTRCSADKRPFDKSLILDTHERCALDLQPAAAASTAMRRPSYGHRGPRPPPLCASARKWMT